MAAPQSITLTRTRGDTRPDGFALTDEVGAVVDITSWTFILTVDPSPDPVDATNNLFAVAGVISDAPNGKFQFDPLLADVDQVPNTYFCDIQATDNSGNITTIGKGEYIFLQDITK